MIKFPASVDDYAYLLAEDYVATVNVAETELKVGIPRQLLVWEFSSRWICPIILCNSWDCLLCS